MTISSSFKFFENNTLVYHIVDVDVGFENLMFAYLEINYEVNLCNFCITLFWIIDIDVKYYMIITSRI